ncbi:MAG: SUMF1/EgtB/PvdO family nonheme iron enzyme [Phycisphaeraceae bacterium]
MNVSSFLALCLSVSVLYCSPAKAIVVFDWATIDNPNNAPDPATGLGSVSEVFRMATTEVTNGQYTAFLNAKAASDPLKLYDVENFGIFAGISRSGSSGNYRYEAVMGREHHPVTYVTWYSAARFTNWLHNGQGDGNTESGAYDLLGASPTPTNHLSIARSPDASFFLPSEDEWYKAAYHKANSGIAGDYYLYANASNTIPRSDDPEEDPSAVNFFNDDGIDNGFNNGYAVWNGTDSDSALTDVGAYELAASPYGTFDQNGNAWEWNEAIIAVNQLSDGTNVVIRSIRGGSFDQTSPSLESTFRRIGEGAAYSSGGTGFRVATLSLVTTTAGDTDGDGDVDDTDLGTAFVNYTGPLPVGTGGKNLSLGDTDTDGDVDDTDLGTAFVNYTGPLGPGPGDNVPEPASVVLLGVGMAGVLRRSKH